MKRFMTALGLAAAISLFCVSPSSAAPTPVQQSRVKFSLAAASWDIPTNDDLKTHNVSVGVTQTKSGAMLDFHDDTTIFEADTGDIAQTIITKIEMRSGGFTFTAQQPLKGATLSGTDIPATHCITFYFDGEPDREGQDCTDTTVTMSVNWVGVGETSRDVSQFHIGPPISDRIGNTLDITFARQATATGTFNGQNLGTADQAVLGTNTNGQICVGCS